MSFIASKPRTLQIYLHKVSPPASGVLPHMVYGVEIYIRSTYESGPRCIDMNTVLHGYTARSWPDACPASSALCDTQAVDARHNMACLITSPHLSGSTRAHAGDCKAVAGSHVHARHLSQCSS